MALPKLLLIPLLSSLAAARQCSNFLIPVHITSRQGQFKQVPVESNIETGAFAVRYNEFGTNYSTALLEGYHTLQKSYNISAQYCRPDASDYGNGGVIQVLTHGIGFDKTYWDIQFHPGNYSYVNAALAAGYSTLAIDRLGIGNSSHGDPLSEIQAQAEVEALNAVTTKVRNGDISQIGRRYNKVVHVGHSFGSIQSYWLSSLYPDNTDGVVLTGYSAAAQFLPYIVAGWNLHSARLNQPFRFGNESNEGIRRLAAHYNASVNVIPSFQQLLSANGIGLSSHEILNIVSQTEILDLITGYNETVIQYNYPHGYMASSDLISLQYAFLYPGNYDINLAINGEKTKQPVTVGELLTIGSAPTSSSFEGPVLVFTGEHDVPFCGGNCLAVLPNSTPLNIPAGVKMAFAQASAFESYIQPDTGHGLNFHYNASVGYQVILDWLARNGLGA